MEMIALLSSPLELCRYILRGRGTTSSFSEDSQESVQRASAERSVKDRTFGMDDSDSESILQLLERERARGRGRGREERDFAATPVATRTAPHTSDQAHGTTPTYPTSTNRHGNGNGNGNGTSTNGAIGNSSVGTPFGNGGRDGEAVSSLEWKARLFAEGYPTSPRQVGSPSPRKIVPAPGMHPSSPSQHLPKPLHSRPSSSSTASTAVLHRAPFTKINCACRADMLDEPSRGYGYGYGGYVSSAHGLQIYISRMREAVSQMILGPLRRDIQIWDSCCEGVDVLTEYAFVGKETPESLWYWVTRKGTGRTTPATVTSHGEGNRNTTTTTNNDHHHHPNNDNSGSRIRQLVVPVDQLPLNLQAKVNGALESRRRVLAMLNSREVTDNEFRYMAKRVCTLAEGNLIDAYQWNGGGYWEGKRWRRPYPTDAELIWRLFKQFLQKKGAPAKSVVVSAGQENLADHADVMVECCSASGELTLRLKSRPVAPGFHNLWETLVHFILAIHLRQHDCLGAVDLKSRATDFVDILHDSIYSSG
jgi:hypothetical protein